MRNLLELEDVTGFFLRRRKHGPDKQMGCRADIGGTFRGTALERGIHQLAEVIENGRRQAAGLPAACQARLMMCRPGSKVTDDLDKDTAVDPLYLDFHNAFYPLEEGRGAEGLSKELAGNPLSETRDLAALALLNCLFCKWGKN